MPELAVLVPTRGRPENIRRLIGAWDFTNAWDVADLVVVADADDPEIQQYREVVAETEHPDTGEVLVRLIEMDRWMPMVHKLNAVADELATGGTTFAPEPYWALAFAGDDHVPETIGWAKTYLEQLHELGSGMVYGDDGYQGVKLATEWAITADAVRALGGRMVPAPVEHMYCDNAMMDLFGGARALRHLPWVRIDHRHPIAKKAATDAQYQRVNHRDQFRKDRAAYDGWRRSGMARDVAAIRSLRSGRPDEVLAAAPVEPEPTPPYTGPMRSGPTSRRITEMKRNQFLFSHKFRNVRGATPDEVAMALADMAATVPADQEIVELGVFQGRTAMVMAWGAEQGQGAHVTGIDAWDLEGNTYDPPFTEPESREWALYRIRELGYEDRINLVQEFSVAAAERWAAEIEVKTDDEPGEDPGVFSGAIPWAKPVGLLFVDADHTKEGARADIEAWAPLLAPGARIAVDDYDHPDWPGVREAVDELVAEGFLAPIDLFHDRLAVTRLAAEGDRQPRTVTSEGVTPSPYPAAEGQVAVTEQHGPATVTEVEPVAAEPGPDTQESSFTEPPLRTTVHEGELEGVAEGTPVQDLTLPQIKALAKLRGITLGIRKDKKADAIQALVDGR